MKLEISSFDGSLKYNGDGLHNTQQARTQLWKDFTALQERTGKARPVMSDKNELKLPLYLEHREGDRSEFYDDDGNSVLLVTGLNLKQEMYLCDSVNSHLDLQAEVKRLREGLQRVRAQAANTETSAQWSLTQIFSIINDLFSRYATTPDEPTGEADDE